MSLKTSLSDRIFSKAVIKADLRNHWMWPVTATVLMLFNFFVVVDSGATSLGTGYSWERLFNRFISDFSFCLVVAVIFSFMLGTKLFMYLDKMNSVSCMHGMPFSRRKLYMSHIASGIAVISIPPAILTVIMLIAGVPFNNTVFTPDMCIMFFVTYMIYALITFGITVFSMMVCGNVIVSMLLSVGIAVLPAAILAFIEYVCHNCLYGYHGGTLWEDIILFLYIVPDQLYPLHFLLYLLGGIAFLVAGYFVYKFRPLENCDEVVAFRKLRWLFVITVGVVLGMISYLFFTGLLDGQSLMWALPLGLLGVVAAAMIAKKSVSIRGTGRYIIIYTICTVILTLGTSYDLFGYERKVPDVSKIESVSVDMGWRNTYYMIENPDLVPDYAVTDPDDIETIRQLHKAYISEKATVKDDSNRYYGLKYTYADDDAVFTYKLKNGSTVVRRYSYLSIENFDKYMKPVQNIDIIKSREYPLIDSTQKEFLTVTVYDDRINDPAVSYSFGSGQAEILYDAMMKDIMSNSYEDLNGVGTLTLSFEYYVPGTTESYGQKPSSMREKREVSATADIRLNSNYKNTLAALEEIGYEIHSEKALSTMTKLTIASDGYYIEYPRGEVAVEYYDGKYSTVSSSELSRSVVKNVTDPEHIRAFYELCGIGFSHKVSPDNFEAAAVYNFAFLESDNVGGEEGEATYNVAYGSSFTVIVDELPKELQQYFK